MTQIARVAIRQCTRKRRYATLEEAGQVQAQYAQYVRACLDKTPYPTIRAAEEEARRLPQRLYVYACPYRPHYHLTRQVQAW
jgi:hypothetical protein